MGLAIDAADRGQTRTIEIAVETIDDLDALEARWRRLESLAAPSFFLSWHWIGTWLAVGADRPLLLVARRDGVEVGLGLLHLRTVWRFRALTRVAGFLNQTGDPERDIITIEYNDVLADPDLVDAVRAAVVHRLLRDRQAGGVRLDELHLQGVTEAVAARLPSARALSVHPSARIDLRAIGPGGDLLDHVSANTRRQIRRAMALYQERGPLRLKAADSTEEALAFFAAAGALHQKRWTGRGEPGAFAYPFFIRFNQELIRRALPDGGVEVVRASAGAEDIGYLVNYLYRGTVYYYFSGFAYETDNRLKPGLVSHYLCVDRHLEAGTACYDFMGGANRYKYSLGTPGPTIKSVVLERPGPLVWTANRLRRLKAALAGTGIAAGLGGRRAS